MRRVTKLVTAPQFDPVSLREFKAHLRIAQTDISDDNLLWGKLRAGVEAMDAKYSSIGRALMPQTWELVLQCWPACNYIELPYPPLATVQSVTYLNDASPTVSATFAEFIASTDREPGRITLPTGGSWPSGGLLSADPIRIRYTCGYIDASQVPARIREAILLIGEKLYDGHALTEMSDIIDRAVANLTVNYQVEHAF